jgi:hypothetical protein
MWRLMCVAALAASVCLIRPASAPAQDDVKKLEAELTKLRGQVQEVEARLKKAKEEAAKKDEKRPTAPGAGWGGRGPRGGFGRMDPDRMKEMREQFEKMRGERGRGFGRGGFGAPWLRREAAPPEAAKTADVEKRLDQILKELEALKKELKK